MKVTLIDHMGSDLTVVNAARVSYNKTSEYETREVGYDEDSEPCVPHTISTLSTKDKKLIKYLAKHNHWSPFAHCFLQFRIKAPLFVARQLVKHQVGLSWNEVSRRYVDDEPEFYTPLSWRGRAANNKQGSEGVAESQYFPALYLNDVCEQALSSYKKMLQQGVAPEMARIILPQNMYTEWYWSGSLMAFARVCKQRCTSDTQAETADIADMIEDEVMENFPHSYAALQGAKNELQ
jgi:thymidylate synthase (FAD)